jgi:hypothetical protein
MNEEDQNHHRQVVSLIVGKHHDERIVAAAYAHLKETRGKAVADHLITLCRLYRPRRTIDGDQVQAEVGELFEYELTPSAKREHQLRVAYWGIPLFALFLIALVVASVFGYEPKGFGIVAFAMLAALAASLIYWFDDGMAEFTGKVAGGKFKILGAVAVFVVVFAVVIGVLKFTNEVASDEARNQIPATNQ